MTNNPKSKKKALLAATLIAGMASSVAFAGGPDFPKPQVPTDPMDPKQSINKPKGNN